MFNKKYIAGIASFAGTAINNVKADTTGDVTIKIGEKSYSFVGNKLSDNSKKKLDEVLGLIAALGSNLKLNGNGDVINLKDVAKEYFIKEIKEIDNNPSADIKFDTTSCSCNIATTKPILIELVKKEDKVNIKYEDSKVNGGRLTKASEKKILESISQGLKNSEINAAISLNNLEFSFGGYAHDESTKIVGTDIKLFENDNKIDFTITKLPNDGFKTVVCNFANDVQTVEELDFEKYVIGGLGKKGLKTSEIIAELNVKDLLSGDEGKNFFKNDAKFKALKDGTGTALESTNSTGVDFDSAKFIVLSDIKVDDINAKFLKKTFDVKLDTTDTSKTVDSEKITELNNLLNEKFGNSVKFTTKDICDILKTKNGIINNAFTGNIKIGKGGADVEKGCSDDSSDLVDDKTTIFVIKLPETAFAVDIVKTTINLTCNLDNVKKDDKKLKGEVKKIISNVLNTPLDKVTPIDDIITKLNTVLGGKFADGSKKIEATDINFDDVKEGTSIKKSGNITINNTFAGKLNDDCFEAKKDEDNNNKDQNENDKNSKEANGDGGNQDDGNKDEKGYCKCGRK